MIRRTWFKHEPLAFTAFVFVLFALIALAVTPVILLRQLRETTRQVTGTVLPAFAALNDLLFAADARVLAARSAVLTGDTAYMRQLQNAESGERVALAQLVALIPRFDSAYATHVAVLSGIAARRDFLEESLGGRDRFTAPDTAEYHAALLRFDALHDSMFAEARHLRRQLLDVAEQRTAETARWARLQGLISIILGVLALIAAVIVGWFTYVQLRQRKRIREALGEANRLRNVAEQRREELERVTESRIRLLSGITHDVKNPLGAARGYAELLQLGIKGPLSAEQRSVVDGIQRSLDQGLAIINDLLDISRAESGHLAIRKISMDLAGVVREAVEDHQAMASRAGHRINFAAQSEPLFITSDPARVRQVVDNLLSNAIKYTPRPGRISISVGVVQPPEAEGARAIVRVSDTGPGIPPEMREAIFDEFRRVSDQTVVKGHGLGLAISRRVARMLGGDLTLEDLDVPGATFVFSIPLDRRQPGV